MLQVVGFGSAVAEPDHQARSEFSLQYCAEGDEDPAGPLPGPGRAAGLAGTAEWTLELSLGEASPVEEGEGDVLTWVGGRNGAFGDSGSWSPPQVPIFEALPETIEIPAKKKTANIVVRPIADGLVEAPETIELELVPGDTYAPGAVSRAVTELVSKDK